MMKFGIGLPQREGTDLRTDVVMVAREAESVGFSSLWAYERLLYPVNPADGLYGIDGLSWLNSYRQAADPLSVLAVAASVTERIRLGTSVLVAPLHMPVQLAKTLATIDRLSGGGRLVAGLGTGWSTDELAAVGTDLRNRGGVLDETLDVLQAVWGADPVTYHGKRVSLDEVVVLPKPTGSIPVMLGGGAPAVFERIGGRLDGWLPAAVPPDQLRDAVSGIRDRARAAGRDPDRLEVIYRANIAPVREVADQDRVPFVGSVEQIVDDALAVEAAGATELILELQLNDDFVDTRQMLDTALDLRDRIEKQLR